MDVVQELMQNKLIHMEDDVRTISRQLSLLQEFVAQKFELEFREFVSKKEGSRNRFMEYLQKQTYFSAADISTNSNGNPTSESATLSNPKNLTSVSIRLLNQKSLNSTNVNVNPSMNSSLVGSEGQRKRQRMQYSRSETIHQSLTNRHSGISGSRETENVNISSDLSETARVSELGEIHNSSADNNEIFITDEQENDFHQQFTTEDSGNEYSNSSNYVEVEADEMVDVKYVSDEGEMNLPVECELSDPLNSREDFGESNVQQQEGGNELTENNFLETETGESSQGKSFRKGPNQMRYPGTSRTVNLVDGGFGRQCLICMKVFSQQSSVERHMKIHTQERDHACSSCNATYYRKDHLARHIKQHEKQIDKAERFRR